MVLKKRLSYLEWGFVGAVLTAPVNRWLAVAMENQPTTCPSQILFGVACPLCGATRASLHLASGDVLTAVEFNAGLVAFSVAVGVVLLNQQRNAIVSATG